MSHILEQASTAWVAGHLPGAAAVLRRHGIAADSRMSLAAAAAAASITPDALFAELAYRDQLATRRRHVERETAEMEREWGA